MTEFLPENEKEEYEDFNNLLRLKDSIKSGLIKEMLAEEDMNVNNKIIDESNKKKKNKKTIYVLYYKRYIQKVKH